MKKQKPKQKTEAQLKQEQFVDIFFARTIARNDHMKALREYKQAQADLTAASRKVKYHESQLACAAYLHDEAKSLCEKWSKQQEAKEPI